MSGSRIGWCRGVPTNAQHHGILKGVNAPNPLALSEAGYSLEFEIGTAANGSASDGFSGIEDCDGNLTVHAESGETMESCPCQLPPGNI